MTSVAEQASNQNLPNNCSACGRPLSSCKCAKSAGGGGGGEDREEKSDTSPRMPVDQAHSYLRFLSMFFKPNGNGRSAPITDKQREQFCSLLSKNLGLMKDQVKSILQAAMKVLKCKKNTDEYTSAMNELVNLMKESKIPQDSFASLSGGATNEENSILDILKEAACQMSEESTSSCGHSC